VYFKKPFEVCSVEKQEKSNTDSNEKINVSNVLYDVGNFPAEDMYGIT
jgi:hypothetical protein